MAHFIRNLLRKMKYGQEVIVVSGLPRSGTSMMMRMLEGGGLAIMTDQVRTADDDNPKGYYEYERVKDLETDTDKSYVKLARGKVLKVISFLLKDLPSNNFYRIVFMRRDTDEILASQNKMLVNRGEANEVEDERLKELYKQHLLKVNSMVRWLSNYEMLEVHYKDAIDDPKKVARQVNQFLGGNLDEQKMHEAVDRKLYRNRKEAMK